MDQENDQRKIADLLDRYLKNNASEAEKSRIITWIESLNEEERIELSEKDQSEIKERIWNALDRQDRLTSSIKPSQAVRTFSPAVAWRVAASVIFILGFAWYYASDNVLPVYQSNNFSVNENLWQDIRNNSGEPMEVALEDGTRIILQPTGTLSHMSFKNVSERVVKLRGEAYFDVAPDARKPFVVYAEKVVTRVLGTRFTIKAPENGKNISVMVSSGKVSVSGPIADAKEQEVILTPNQEVVYNTEKQEFLKNRIEKNTIAEVSKLVFDEEPVGDILRLFETVYEIDIEFDETVLNNCKVTTAFSEEGLYERLTILTRIIGASYTESDGKIVITSSGCN